MPTLRVDPENPDPDRIARAAEVIRGGGLVAFPTETVYGLGADALDEAAVARIYQAKGRPAHNPLIVHVADADAAGELVAAWPESAERLARAFWPGPLTLVLPRGGAVPELVSAGLPTVAVRVPAHPVALALLRAARVPIVAPSANPSMAVSPTRAHHVERGLGDRVDLILDGGATRVGIESTVVDLTTGQPILLRPGALSTEQLAPVIGEVVPHGAAAVPENAPRASPGMLERHYAPRATVRLFDPLDPAGADAAVSSARQAAAEGRAVCALLLDEGAGSGREPAAAIGAAVAAVAAVAGRVVRLPADPEAYARELYSALHELDEHGCDLLLVRAVPGTPAWAGIRDRLMRAASSPSGGDERSG